MREIIEIVRIVQSGERVAYKGRVYELPLPGGEGKAIRSSMGAAPHPDAGVPRDARPEEPRDDGRGRRWLARHVVHARARRIFFEPDARGRVEGGRALERMDLQAGGVVAFGDDIER